MASQLNLDNLVVRKPRVQGIGLVKAVLSGDSIVVVGSAKNGTPIEKRLILSGISAPRLGQAKVQPQQKKGEKAQDVEKDEPYAYAAREFLSQRILGQVVNFVLPNVNVDAINGESRTSEYAEVTMGNINLAEFMVKNGLAKVNLPKPKTDDSEDNKKKALVAPAAAVKVEDLSAEKQALYALQVEAQKAKIGLWAGNDAKAVRSFTSVDLQDLWAKAQHKELSAHVEYVVTGSLLRLEIKNPFADLKQNPLAHTLISVQLAGVEAPQTDSKDKKGDAFGAEAKKYVAERLQGQEVKVVLQAFDPHSQVLFGTIVYPKGNISLKLLQEGFAKYVPWSALATTNNTELKFAAVQAKANLAKESPYVEPTRVSYEATVTQIVSGNVLQIKLADGTEKRVQLASIKAPKANKGKDAGKPEPFSFEAQEFLRRSLINKKVNVQVEFVSTPKEGDEKKEDRELVSMFKGKYNIATELLANGLATVAPTGRDQPRSLYYAELCAAHTKALKEKKNLHNPSQSYVIIEDLTARPSGKKQEQAKTQQTAVDVKLNDLYTKLSTGNQVSGVLDAVFSPGRMRVILPSLNVAVPVKVAAINTPYVDKESDEFTEEQLKEKEAEAKELNEKILAYLKQFTQQDVAIEVTAKQGSNLVANIIIKDAANKENVAVSLLNQGLVTVNSVVVERNKHAKQLLNAQDYARKSKLGVWKNFDEQKAKEEAEKRRQEQAAQVGVGIYTKDGEQFINVTVTEVNDPIHFYVNCPDDKNVQIVNDAMAAFDGDAVTPKENWVPKEDDIVAGKFAADGKWYRVRIEKVSKTLGKHKVQFVDFGNYDAIPHSDIKPLPIELSKIRPLAKPASLTCCVAPLPNSEYYEFAMNGLTNLTDGKVFAARIDNTQRNGVLNLTLIEEGAEQSINEILLEQGVVLLADRVPAMLQNVQTQFTKANEEARNEHRGVYTFGDYTLEGDDDRD